MKFPSLLLSCSLLGFLTNSVVMAMEEEDKSIVTIQSQRKEPAQTLPPFDFIETLPYEMRYLVVKQAAYESCLENDDLDTLKIALCNLALVCTEWREIIKTEMTVGRDGWKAWHGIITPENEEIYQRFLNGVLIYRPDPKSDKGMIKLKISDLENPLGSSFDLSSCGETGKCLSISLGYRKGKKSENDAKVEIWFVPRFLINTKLQGSARHFAPIMSSWDEKTAPIGLFFTWSEWDRPDWYDYLTSQSMEDIGSGNLLAKYLESRAHERCGEPVNDGGEALTFFHISFLN